MLLTQRRNLKKNHNMFNILIKGKFDILIRDAGNFVLYTFTLLYLTAQSMPFV